MGKGFPVKGPVAFSGNSHTFFRYQYAFHVVSLQSYAFVSLLLQVFLSKLLMFAFFSLGLVI